MREWMVLGDFRAFTGRSLFALLALLSIAAGCSTDSPAPGDLAQGCSINSDCKSPLVCAFRSCHSACAATRDCPAGLPSVASDRPFHVCQLVSERACTLNSSCPEGQVCAVDGQCRDQCHAESDCLSGQRCVSGACAEPSELRDGGLPVVDKEAGPPTGQSCSYNSQCMAPLICRDGACQQDCLSSIDCKNRRHCVRNPFQIPICPEADAGAGNACKFGSDCSPPLVCRSGTCTCGGPGAGDCSA